MLGEGADFAGYRIEGVLGEGGMGTVYRARHPRLPRTVALKLLNREVCTDPELTRRFEREADVVARLEHPGIVGVLDRGADDGHLWIAMQYIRGADAASWDGRAHPPGTVARLLGDTASALDYAHSCGVLHRDVKPANILITAADTFHETRAILTDFGIARLTDADSTKVTATGTFTATLAYGSPEQLSGEVVDHRTDQYSLACTMFAMYSGRPPYAATNPGQVVLGHLSQPIPRLTAARPDLPPGLDAVLARALAKQRDDRFPTCGHFVAAVRDALDGRHIHAPIPPSAPTVRTTPGVGDVVTADPQPHVPGAAPTWVPSGSTMDPEMADEEVLGPPPPKSAAVLAGTLTLSYGLICTILFLGVLALTVVGLATGRGGSPATSAVLAVAFLVPALLWNSAALLLLSGRRAGRILTLLCSGAAFFVAAIACLAFVVAQVITLPLAAACGASLIVSGTALVCAASGSARRWVDYRTAYRIEKYGY